MKHLYGFFALNALVFGNLISLSLIFDHKSYLADARADPDQVENRIGEDALEHVALAVNLARIELVEQRHHHERIEDDGEVLAGRLAVAGLDVQHLVACRNDGGGKTGL